MNILQKLISFSIHNRIVVLLLAFGVACLGTYDFTRLPIDAVPDITNVQVQINSPSAGLSPIEIEKRITFPIETAMSGLPKLEQIRSLSRYGLSQVTVIFQDGTDIFWARQLVAERLQEAKEVLPAGLTEPTMGPMSTGLGEIFLWALEADPNATTEKGKPIELSDIRTLQDWVVRPQLLTVPGVTEVNSIGGFEKQIHVTPYPEKLMAHGLTFPDILDALEKNNSFTGGGYIEHRGEQYLVQASGLVSSASEIENIPLATDDGVPVSIKDVAKVFEGGDLRTGAATLNGKESVVGTAMMMMGGNSRIVSTALLEKVKEIQRTLPSGVTLRVIYNRSKLVDATIHTVQKNLLEGALLVISVLFLILGNVRVALFVALAIPLSMLFAISGMVFWGISGNLLSLGAIDFGIIIDGSVVMAENIIRRFAERQKYLGRTLTFEERIHEAYHASGEVAGPTLSGVGIIMIVYLPILTLSGIEGKMFVPMAQVVLLALFGALVTSFTVIPALLSAFLRGSIREEEGRVFHLAKNTYRDILARTIRFRVPVLLSAILLLIASTWLGAQLGSEFVPQLDEKDLAVQALRIPSTSLSQSLEMQKKVEEALLSLPEVELTFARVGTSQIATDPMPPSIADGYVILKPRDLWPDPKKSKEQLVKEVDAILDTVPGNLYEISQPIQLRFNELISGVRSDVAVKIFGDDLSILSQKADEIQGILSSLPGSSGVKKEQISGLPSLKLDIRREELARYGLTVKDVQDVISIAIGGKSAGLVFDGDRRFPIVVRLPETLRTDLEEIRQLPIPLKTPGRRGILKASHSQDFEPRTIPLEAVANISVHEGPNQISRENGKRRIVVQTNIQGEDLGTFVSKASQTISEKVKLPPGYWLSWGGQFENLQAARLRLEIVVPVALFLILLILYSTFQSMKESLIVFSGVPFALTGGIFALWIREIPFSISAGVGFIALSGVAVLNGIVMISFIRKLLEEGMELQQAILEGSLSRFRPVVMTALVASLGFIPMAVSHGTGAEVQRPLATVVIGGILSSTILTLLVLPTLYSFLRSDLVPKRAAQKFDKTSSEI